MKQRKAAINSSTVQEASCRAKDYINNVLKKAENLKTDPEKKERLKQNLCPSCYYINNLGFGGARMTSRDCGICEKEMMFSSTATDSICSCCATENELCKRCNADIKLRTRRIFKK